MPFQIIRDDITHVRADAIVNTANPDPVCGGGTDHAIYESAGREKLLRAREKIGPIARGQAVETPAFHLHARYIIHTVGPVWAGGGHGEFEILRSCYENSLQLALRLQCRSIAFPLIATGTYGFPKDKALQIALSVIEPFVMAHEMKVILVVFDRRAFELSGNLVEQVREFVDANYVAKANRSEYSEDGTGDLRSRSFFRKAFGKMNRAESAEPDDMVSLNMPVSPQSAKSVSGSPAEKPSLNASVAMYDEEGTPTFPASASVRCMPAKQKQSVEDDFALCDSEEPEAVCPSCSPYDLSDDFDGQTMVGYASMPDSVQAKQTPTAYHMMQSPGNIGNASTQNYNRAVNSARSRQPAPERTLAREKVDIGKLIAGSQKTFQEKLFEIIDERGLTGPQVYKNYISKQVFSKIQADRNYHPNKFTAIALCLSLHLSIEETQDLIGRAGWALSPSNKADLVVTGCIMNGEYNLVEINIILFDFNCPELEKIR